MGIAAQHGAAAAFRLIRRFGAPHRRLFARGMVATLLVVVACLVLPWPLRGIIDLASAVNGSAHGGTYWLPMALALVGTYVAIATGLGYFELAQRVSFKAFAVRTVHLMRATAVDVVHGAGPQRDTPDLLTRIIGDTARIKAELSGILVHVSQNGLLFLGICVLFMFLSPKLGIFFLGGGFFAIAIGYRATRNISSVTKAQREKEAAYATYVHGLLVGQPPADDGSDANEGSARADANATRLIAVSAWIVHIGLAAITAVALLIAVHEVQQGSIQLGEVFLFIAYLLIVHRRMIQVGRQLARSGKLIANTNRVGELLGTEPARAGMAPLEHRLELPVPTGRAPASGKQNIADSASFLTFYKGSRTAVLERSAADRCLFDILAGPGTGVVRWDEAVVRASDLGACPEVGYVPKAPDLGRRKLKHFLGERARLETREARVLGLPQLVADLPDGLRTRASSVTLSRNEAQACMLARLLWQEQARGGVWLIDDPVSGLARRRARRLLKLILEYAGDRTVVIALPYPLCLSRFDRLIVLDDGRAVYDGLPAGWPADARINAA